MKYIKTTPIEAEQFNGWMKTVEKYHIRIVPANNLSGIIDELVPRGRYYLMTLEGELEIHQGDWIATDVDDEHWAIKDDIFRKTYAELPVIPKHVADWIEFNRDKANLADMLVCAQFRIVNFDDYKEIEKWINADVNRFSRAWLDGYQVEGGE